MEDENLTIEQVAKILKLSKQTVWKRCKWGQLPAFKLPPSHKWYVKGIIYEHCNHYRNYSQKT